MGNVVNLARKEFSDLLGSKLVLIILSVYLCIFLATVYTNYSIYCQYGFENGERAVRSLLGVLIMILLDYGSVVALIIGFSAIYKEVESNALNTLLVKPVYRDTIINGKFLAGFAFLVCVTVFSALMYVVLILVLYGSGIASYLISFLGLLPIGLFISLASMAVFFSLAFLITLLFKEKRSAMFVNVLAWLVIVDTIPSMNFAGSIGYLFGGDMEVTNDLLFLSPKGISNLILLKTTDLSTTLSVSLPEVFGLIIYVVVLVVLCYIVFLRRDVA